VRRYVNGGAKSVECAWDEEALHTFGEGSRATKGCPRSAFLGLCSEGRVSGIPKGNYVRKGSLNSGYALIGLRYLQVHGDVAQTGLELWRTIGFEKTYNQQMHVVLSLWREGMIRVGDG
jgi:hypothetical protein